MRNMRLKHVFLLFGSLITFALLCLIYYFHIARNLGSISNKNINNEYQNQWLHFETRLKQLENSFNKHNNAVDEIKEAMNNMLVPPPEEIRNNQQLKVLDNVKYTIYESTCPFQINLVPRTSIQMLDVYELLKFDNPDGGVWKQGWDIKIDERDWNRHNKLHVFVVPHSHNDPGWIRTVEEYYLQQTKHILDNMLVKLPEDPRRKFIWAEISFFSMWWEELNDDQREGVKRLLANNQLEIVTGGWVMNDEANSHWISILHQLTEGHQWLQQHLNYTPRSGWSIDPFGYSLTQPLLLKESGLTDMLIQRVHYSVKKHFASTQQLEFRWRQLWDTTGKTDMFTHMMPFYSYDIPHTCGPDPKICCQFDFKRLPGHGVFCPWRISPQPITEKNVAQKAELLLDQYRKKSKLYKTNVLLVPLGDDFRYDHSTEWDVQFENYQKLFDYMNSKLDLNVHAQFGTLSDYFTALHKSKKELEFPTLSGDFFTYADRDDHYFSGYYTSRPFYKRMDRVLLSYIRAAETIHTIAELNSQQKGKSTKTIDGLQNMLSSSRQALSLFQHHDGITGTAKDHVVVDYGKKMLAAITNCQKVIQASVHTLLNNDDIDLDTTYYNVDDVRHSHDALADRYQITIEAPTLRTKRVAIYNPLTFDREEVVTFFVSTPFVEITTLEGKKIDCQVSPIFEHVSSVSQTKYQLSFIANIPALGVKSFIVNALFENEIPSETHYAKVFIYNQANDLDIHKKFHAEISPKAREFSLNNNKLTASFNTLGLLKAIKINDITYPTHLEFVKYGVKFNVKSEKSGAYLFLPEDSGGNSLKIENTIVNVIMGPILSSVIVQLPYVHHVVNLYKTNGADSLGIEIENTVDISTTFNYELAMRLSTNIDSGENFYTDLNGYQIIRRERFQKLPIQANFYPMPTMIYIEDKATRLSILTGSPLGCSSLTSGQIDIMLDRRLNQDDNLGLGQGVLDNHPTKHVFRLILEQRKDNCKVEAQNHPAGFPSIAAHLASQTLLNPLIRLLRTDDDDFQSKEAYFPTKAQLPIDLSMPTLKTNVLVKNKKYIGLTLHRQYVDQCFGNYNNEFPIGQGLVNVSSLLPLNNNFQMNRKLFKTSLSFLLLKNEIDIKSNLSICPMEMEAFIIQ